MAFNFDEFKYKAHKTIKTAASATGDALIGVGTWVKDNPEAATIIAGGLGVVIKEGGKIKRNSDRRKEEELKDRRFYDHSAGYSYVTRRKPTNSERLEIDRRRRNGERLGDILSSMRLL